MGTPSDSGFCSGTSTEHSHLLKTTPDIHVHFGNLSIGQKYSTNVPVSHDLYKNRTDFFRLFLRKTSNTDVCMIILRYLNPKDLTALDCVCKRASKFIRANNSLNDLRLRYLYDVKIYKENVEISLNVNHDQFRTSTPNDQKIPNLSLIPSVPSVDKCGIKQPFRDFNRQYLATRSDPRRSPEGSPTKRKWLRFVKLSQNLRPNEKLQRCINCSNPAIVLNNVVRCTRRGCLFMYCDLCFNPTCDSVEFFKYHLENDENLEFDKLTVPIAPPPCSQSGKILRPSKEATSTSTLSDISNSSIFSIVSTKSTVVEKDGKMRVRRLLFSKSHSYSHTSQSFGSLAETSIELTPPESPPHIQINDFIGSKQSKKRLKRL